MPFGLDLVQWLEAHRSEGLTAFFQACTFLGEVEGYVLVVVWIHVAFDKDLAVRLAVLALVTMCANHMLKILVQMPRPFVAGGGHLEAWAVSPEKAEELVHEFSTPSGHAMAGGAFYSFLALSVARPWILPLSIAAILATGLSRPYLGVHYLEDVLLGWPLGIGLALLAHRYRAALGRAWRRMGYGRQVGAVVLGSAALWGVTWLRSGGPVAELPTPFVAYAGFLTGIVAATPLERARVAFDPRSGTWLQKGLRYAISVGLVGGTLVLLGSAADRLTPEPGVLDALLRYLRYALAAGVGLVLAPALFVSLGLAPSRGGGPDDEVLEQLDRP